MSAAVSNDDLLEQLYEIARTLGLRRWGVMPDAVKLHLPDGREQVEIVPVLPQKQDIPQILATPSNVYQGEPWHNEDFTVVRWPGQVEYRFTPKQSKVVATLWDALDDDSGDTSRTQADLLAIAESDCTRLRDLFSRHRAWGKLIVGDGRGNYRLPMGTQEV